MSVVNKSMLVNTRLILVDTRSILGDTRSIMRYWSIPVQVRSIPGPRSILASTRLHVPKFMKGFPWDFSDRGEDILGSGQA